MSNRNTTIGILSDSHGYLDPRIKHVVNGCDYILHAGDIFNADVLAQLKPTKELIAVAGNNDYPAVWPDSQEETVNTLPEIAELHLPSGKICIEHGHRLGNKPDHEQLRNDHTDAKLIIYGHTHHRIIDQTTAPWVVNPGASGSVRTHGGPSCLIVTANEKEWSIREQVFKAPLNQHS